MRVVFVTGATGVEKRAALTTTQHYAEAKGLVEPGDLRVYHVEEVIKERGRNLRAFADITAPDVQQSAWASAVDAIGERVAALTPRPRCVVVVMHYFYYYRTRIFSPVTWEPLRRLARLADSVAFVSLIDDCYAMWARIATRTFGPRPTDLRLKECFTWRSIETTASDQCAGELMAGEANPPPTASYVVAVNQPPITLVTNDN